MYLLLLDCYTILKASNPTNQSVCLKTKTRGLLVGLLVIFSKLFVPPLQWPELVLIVTFVKTLFSIERSNNKLAKQASGALINNTGFCALTLILVHALAPFLIKKLFKQLLKAHLDAWFLIQAERQWPFFRLNSIAIISGSKHDLFAAFFCVKHLCNNRFNTNTIKQSQANGLGQV